MSIDLPFSFNPIFKGAPIEGMVFSTTAALNAYLTSPVRYAGMAVSLVEGGVVTQYKLSAAEDAWEPAGGGGSGGSGIESLASTGLHSGAVLAIGATVGTFDLSVGEATHVDSSAYPTVDSTDFSITARTNEVVTGILIQPVTYILVSKLDVIIQQASFPTPQERRDNLFLGVVVHSDNTIVNLVNNLPEIATNVSSQLHDLMQGMGLFNVSGNIVTANGANMTMNKSLGIIFKEGINFNINSKDPHRSTISATTALTFRYRNQDSAEGVNINIIDPTTYDLAGVITTVPNNNNATIQRVYIFPSGAVRVQRGQEIFSTLADAVNALGKESFVVEPNIAENGLLLASVAVKKSTTELGDSADALVFRASRFGELGSVGSSATTTLQEAYENGIDPEITLNAIRNGFAISDALVPIATTLFEITSNDGTVKYLDVSAIRTKIADRHGPQTIREESDVFFQEDFLDNVPTDVFDTVNGIAGIVAHSTTVRSASWVGTALGGSLTHKSTHSYLIDTLLDRTKRTLKDSLLALEIEYFNGADKDDYVITVQESADNITYTDLTFHNCEKTAYIKSSASLIFTPSKTTTHLRYKIENTVAIPSSAIFIYKSQFRKNPLVTQKFVQSETITRKGYTSKNGSNYVLTSVGLVDSSSSLVSITNTDHTRYTFLARVPFIASISRYGNAATPTLRWFDKNNVIKLDSFEDNGGGVANISINSEAEEGDYLVWKDSGTPSFNDNNAFSVTATASSSNVIVEGDTHEHEFFTTNLGVLYTNFWDSTGSQNNFDINSIDLSESKYIQYDDTTETRIVAKQDCIVDYVFEGTINAGSSIQAYASLADFNGGTPIELGNNNGPNSGNRMTVSGSVKLKVGDYLYGNASNLNNRNGGASFTVSPATIQTQVAVPVTNEVENTFKGKIDAFTGTPSVNLNSDQLSFITSITDNGTGDYTIHFVPGKFTVPPIVEGTGIINGTADVVGVSARDVTTLSARFTVSSGVTAADRDFSISITYDGADYKEPKGYYLGAIPKVVHSNAETWTGERWIDGRKIWMRSYETSVSMASSTEYTLTSNIDSGLTPLSVKGMAKQNGLDQWYNLGVVGSTGSGFIHYDGTVGEILAQNIGLVSDKQIFTIKYLKP